MSSSTPCLTVDVLLGWACTNPVPRQSKSTEQQDTVLRLMRPASQLEASRLLQSFAASVPEGVRPFIGTEQRKSISQVPSAPSPRLLTSTRSSGTPGFGCGALRRDIPSPPPTREKAAGISPVGRHWHRWAGMAGMSRTNDALALIRLPLAQRHKSRPARTSLGLLIFPRLPMIRPPAFSTLPLASNQ